MDGSSPPTWGIPAIGQVVVQRYRFIPTYVGHTITSTLTTSLATVHPHLRGAYALGGPQPPPACGSSPPTWGILLGKKIMMLEKTVHPHLRGAYAHRGRQAPASSGSSPPTWGILGKCGAAGILERFIPTYVGHTKPLPAWAGVGAVHPHLRGAYTGAP